MKAYFSRAVYFFYDQLIARKKKEINFWIMYSFLITFILSRFIVYNMPGLFLTIKGVHVHHFAYGILLLAISGYLALNNWHLSKPRSTAILFGVGLALAVDEFGMWIRLEDDYWYRWSYDAMFIVTTLLTSLVYFGTFWKKLIEKSLNKFQ